VAAILMGATLIVAVLINGVPALPSIDDGATVTTSPAQLNAGESWETERRQQVGIGAVGEGAAEAALRWEALQRLVAEPASRMNPVQTWPELQRVLEAYGATSGTDDEQEFTGQRKGRHTRDIWNDVDGQAPTHPQFR
jgi:hypothetical protein